MLAAVNCEQSSSAETRPSISPPNFRFALSHWLWWLTITAALLAIHRDDMANRNLGDRDPERVERSRLFWRLDGAANLAMTPFHAIAIWAFGLAGWRICRSRNGFPVLPGHWLLVCLGLYVLSHEIVWLIWRYIVVPRWDVAELSLQELEPLWLLQHVLLETLSFVVALLALFVADFRLQAAVRWRAVFWLLTATAGALAIVGSLNAMGFQFFDITNWFEFVGRCTIPVAAFAILCNALFDCFSKSRYDVLHFIGAFVAITAAIHSAMWDIAARIAL